MPVVVDAGIALMTFAIPDSMNPKAQITDEMQFDRRPSFVDYGVTPITVSEEKKIYDWTRRRLTTGSKSCRSWLTGRTRK